MDVLLVFGFLMLVVTFVGHGIWLFVAFVFRSLTEPSQIPRTVTPSTSPKRVCPYCGALCSTTFRNCPTCAKLVEEQPRSPTAKLQSLQRQLDLLLAENVLSLEQFESTRLILQQAVDKHRPPSAEKLPAEKLAELPTLVADEAVESVGQVSNRPAVHMQVEILPVKRSTWTDWLQAFLEEKNIRWGELLAGLLIVGSSVGLVISLWSTLRNAIPYFPALCFLAVTAAIHGAGLYTLRHWRLKTTSRGLLTIALLLVPLNFLTAIALSEQRSATNPLYVTAVAIGVVAYGWITWSGTRELMQFGAAWLSLAVLGSAIGQLVIGRRTSAGLSTLELNGLFALPLTTYVVALLGTSLFVARWRRLTPRRVESLYRLLGIAFFSLAVALSLLLWKSQAVLDTLSRMSPCVSLAAAMIVGVAGRLLPSKFVVPPSSGTVQPPKGGTTNQDIAATAVTLIGAMLMVAAVVLAWPDPERLIVVGVVNFVALSWFGFATGLAPLHFPALESLALAGLIAFHRFGQAIGGAGISDDRKLIDTILLGRSGVVVALMSLLTTTVAALFWRSGSAGASPSQRREHATSYLAAAAGMAVLSFGIAGYAGFWPHVVQPSIDRSLATVVFVLFGIAGMVANERLNRIEIAWAGAVVWLAVFLHALGWNTHLREWLDGVGWLPDRPIVVALLSFATWSLGCAVVGKLRNRFVTPWSAASGRAVVVALFALPWKVWGDFGPHAIYLGWVAALCLGQAHLWQSRNLFSLSQAVTFIAAALGIASFAERQDWWIAHGGNDVAAFFNVRHGHWQIAGLTAAGLPWVLWRRFGGRWAVLARCSDWKVDRVVLQTVVIAAAVTMWFSLWPFLGFERNQRPELWPVVLQPWIARGWDRVLLLLIGWGAVTWSQEEVCRNWLRRSCPFVGSGSKPIRFPWVAALGTLGVGVVLFVLPQFVWSGVPLSRRHQSVDPQTLFGLSMWWVAGAVLVASGLSLLERGRWQVRVLLIACWVVLWQAASHDLVHSVSQRQDWFPGGSHWWVWLDDDFIGWLSKFGLILLLSGGLLEWLHRKLSTQSSRRRGCAIRDDVWGVVGWLCLLPVIVLASQSMSTGNLSGAVWDLLLWVVLLLWRAWTARSAAVAFGASHAWCWIFAAVALISREDPSRYMLPNGEASFVQFLLWSAVALGAFSRLWFHGRDRWRPLEPAWWDWRGDPGTITPWLWQQHWSWGCLLLSSALAAWAILRHVALLETSRPFSGGHVGHVAFALVASSSWLAARRWRHRWHTMGLATLAWGPVLARSWVSVNRDASLGDVWQSYHVWEVVWLVLAVAWTAGRGALAVSATGKSNASESLIPILSHRERERAAAMSLWGDVASLGVVVLAVREFWTHQSVVWPASCVGVVAASMAALAWVGRSQWRAAASTAAVVLATAMAWTRDWDGLLPRNEQQMFWWLEACVIALAFAACAWQLVEVWWQTRRGEWFDSQSRVVTAHVAAGIALAASLAFVIVVDVSQPVAMLSTARRALSWNISDVGGWLMVWAVTAPFVVSWWDRFAKSTIAGMYGSLWLALLLVLNSRELPLGDRWWVWVTGLIASNVAIVGAAWYLSDRVLRRITDPPLGDVGESMAVESLTPALSQGERGPGSAVFDRKTLVESWLSRLTDAELGLSHSQLACGAVVSVLTIVGVLNFEPQSLRMWSVASAALLVPGIALFARSRRRELFQRVALGLGAIWAVDFLWAWMEPQPHADFWLQRSIRALEALALTAFVYGVGLVRVIRPDSDWRRAVQRAARDAGVLAIVALMAVLSLEAWWFDPVNGSPVTGWQIVLVAATLVALAAALLTMALSGNGEVGGRNAEFPTSEFPLPNSQAFVYAAEVVVALLFLHCYLTMPELFRGYLQPYWPLIVMTIAFAGIGSSELCQRAQLTVLSEPLQNSAALLPLIPALGFWVATSRTEYSTVLFAAGLVYVWLNFRRSSFWYVLAASLAGNAGLWSLWSEHGVELLVRPQVWLIPPSVSVLAAAQWNRRRLTEVQLAAIRYPAITLLYVSSAGEMFLTGIAESFWLPIVLMVLSVSGVLAGIWLRVRAFLYLGTSFLLLSLVSMVWHAAEAIDHTWPWWAFGIGLGLGVLTLFGLFERKRNEMLRLLGELKTWER